MQFLTILSHSFQFYKEKIIKILFIALIFSINALLINSYFLPSFRASLKINSSFMISYFLSLIWLLLTSALFELLILYLIKLPNSSLKEIFQESLIKFFPYLGLKIILGLIIFAGIMCFLVPGIVLAIYLIFSVYAFIDQDLSLLKSLKESWRLIKGNWWSVFKMTVIFVLLATFLWFVLGLSLYLVYKYYGVFLGKNSNYLLIFSNFLFNLFNYSLISPLGLIFTYHLYFFVKKQKDQLEEVEIELTQ